MTATNKKKLWHNMQYAIICILVFNKETSSLKSMVIKVPEAVKSGDTVTLTCEYDLENVALYSLRWYWNDEEFYRYIPKESPPYKTFPVTHVNIDISKSGEHTVTLRNINRHLTGNYKCEVSADLPFFHTSILVAQMIVAELPHDDPIIRVSDYKVPIGKNIHAECFSPGSNPEANITWYINNKKIDNNSYSVIIHPIRIDLEETLELKSSISKIDITTNEIYIDQDKMEIKCEASIYNLWKRNVTTEVLFDTPNTGQVAGATLSHSQMDPILFDHGSNSNKSSCTSKPSIVLIFLLIKRLLWR